MIPLPSPRQSVELLVMSFVLVLAWKYRHKLSQHDPPAKVIPPGLPEHHSPVGIPPTLTPPLRPVTPPPPHIPEQPVRPLPPPLQPASAPEPEPEPEPPQRIILPTPPPSLSPPTSQTIPKKRLRLSYRITSIPREVSKQQLQSSLKSLLEEPEQQRRLICSLVPHGNKQTATVTFESGEPPQSFNCKPGIKTSVILDGIDDYLSVDCDFFGMTPLYCAQNPTVE